MVYNFYSGSSIFHIGYIKTATTYLQDYVFSDPKIGFFLAGGSENRAYLNHWFRTSDPYAFDADAISQKMTDMEANGRSKGLVPVWSEETILGDPVTRYYQGPWNLQRLQEIGKDVKIIITIRKQEDLIFSAYAEFLKLNRNSLQDFIGTGKEKISFRPIFHAEHLLYDSTLSAWSDVFGKENVLILPQEILSSEPKRYFEILTRFTGVNNIWPAPEQKSNVRRGGGAMMASQYLNSFFVKTPLSGSASFTQRNVARTLKYLDKICPKAIDRRVEQTWREKINNRFQGFYSDSNKNLAEMTGYDLAALGYSTR